MTADLLAAAVADVRADLAQRYPVRVDTTAWGWSDGVTVEGGVLVAAQANLYVQSLTKALDLAIPRPAVLSDVASAWTLHRWRGLAGTAPVDLHRGATGEDLQTQWTPPGFVRAFAEQGDRSLVQFPDGTVGWVASGRLVDAAPDADPWQAIRRPERGSPLASEGTIEEAGAASRARLGRPYLWGGNTDDAADCSGFVQSVVLTTAGVLLPKNTKDQRQAGGRVPKDAIAPGDLVFVRGRSSRLSHVGIALRSGDGTTVAHSCLSRKKLLEEPLVDFLDRYDFLGARRPIAWADAR